ncbi:MAG: hypothetical protein AAGL66_13095 [Pseudomonadota bacterium]
MSSPDHRWEIPVAIKGFRAPSFAAPAVSTALTPILAVAITTTLAANIANAAGTMTVRNGATVFLLGGTTDADVVVESGGRVSSVGGATPNSGCASVTGLELQPGSIIEIAVGGTTECDDHTGFLASHVSLSGAFLEVTDAGGYIPALNDEVVFLFSGPSAGSGQFANGGPQETVTIGGIAMSIESDGGSGNDFSLVYRSRPSDPIIENIDTVVSGEAEVTFTVENVGASSLTSVSALCARGILRGHNTGVLEIRIQSADGYAIARPRTASLRKAAGAESAD